MIEQHSHIQGVRMDDADQKSQLPVHIILGANVQVARNFKGAAFHSSVVWVITLSFLPNGVIKQHLELWHNQLPDVLDEVSKSMYVDDFISSALR